MAEGHAAVHAAGSLCAAVAAVERLFYFAKVVDAGIYDICGKGASFLGTTLVGVIAQLTNTANAGVAMITILFVIGFILFCKAAKLNK